MMNKAVILVVTFNGSRWIRGCLGSAVGMDVLVLDNGSTDNTKNIIKQEFPEIELQILERNIGFGAANNKLLRIAYDRGYDYFFLLNQDAYLIDNCIDDLVYVAIRNSEYGVLSPIHYGTTDLCVLDSNFLQSLYRYSGRQIVNDILCSNQLNEVYETEFTNAAGWLITRECLQKVGGFDPIFLHYGEDNNYCHRVQYHGLKIGIATNATIVHDRAERKSIQTSLQLLSVEKRMALIQLANPLRKTGSEFRHLVAERLVYILSEIIRLKFGTLRNHLQIIFFILRQRSHAIRSVDVNRSIGMHYLSLDDAQK